MAERPSRATPSGRVLRVAVHAVTAVVSTWPLMVNMVDGVAMGRQPAATVPWFNLWSLRWTASTLPHSFGRWWDAPIFAPQRASYARSELQPVTGLVYGVLDWFVQPSVAYGLLVLSALLLNGLTAAALARRLGARERVATLVGVLAQLVPFLFEQLGVLQLLMVWPVLLALNALLAWSVEPRVRTAAAGGAALAIGALTCSYHTALFGIAALACAPLLMRRTWLAEWRRRMLSASAGAVAFAVIAAPVAVGQQRRLEGARWTDATIRSGSASWHDLVPGGRHWPGTVLVVLAVAGVVVARRRRETWFLVALASVAATLAMGTALSLFGWRPYAVLVDHVGVVARMRSPFRAVALVQLVVVLLATPFVEYCWDRRRRWARPSICLALALVVAPLSLGSGPVAALPPDDVEWVKWLRDHPCGTVAMMPMPAGRSEEDFEATAGWMLQALDHGHPLVNGYTGFFPRDDRSFRKRMAAFPDPATIEELRSMDVRYVVADSIWWDSRRDFAARDLGLTIVLAGPDGVLLDVADPSTARELSCPA